MSENQHTLASSISFTGKGLHTGATVKMTIKPAPADHGIKFMRIDLEGFPTIDAYADNVTETSRSTVIAKGEVRVSTIEHVMAALWGSGVDNAIIEVDGAEVPIGDGSASLWVTEIAKAGLKELEKPRQYYRIDDKISFTIPEKKVEITAYPDSNFSAVVNVDFGSKVIGKQYAALNSMEDFGKEIAPCRTFVFLHEIKPLIEGNLIKGGDLDNAIVIVEHPIDAEEARQIAELCKCEVMETSQTGYLKNDLRFDNEIARHKMLDLMGDLALVGVRLRGRIFANRPGHKANTEFAKMLRKKIKQDETKPSFKYDPTVAPVMDINQVRSLLPHRPPFLLVDKIMHIDDQKVVGIKQVTMNEPFFVGHFPAKPVMPGVLIVEAMAQCGGILALSPLENPEEYLTFFMKIDNVKFKHQVVPGDTLLFELELTEPIRRGIVQMSAKAYVGDILTCEAFLVAMITKDKK